MHAVSFFTLNHVIGYNNYMNLDIEAESKIHNLMAI